MPDSRAPMTPIQRFRAHPAYGESLRRFKAARKAWAEIRDKLDSATRPSMEAYCRSYFEQFGPIVYSGNSANADDYTYMVMQAWLDSMAGTRE